MKKNKYERPLISAVDYELENAVADGDTPVEEGVVVSVTAKGMSIEVTSETLNLTDGSKGGEITFP